MGQLHYQIATHGRPWPGMAASPHGGRLVKTGTIAIAPQISSPVSVPSATDDMDTVATFRAFNDVAYVEIVTKAAAPAPSSTGAHVAEDATLRVIVHPSYGPTVVPIPAGARFAIVKAEALP